MATNQQKATQKVVDYVHAKFRDAEEQRAEYERRGFACTNVEGCTFAYAHAGNCSPYAPKKEDPPKANDNTPTDSATRIEGSTK